METLVVKSNLGKKYSNGNEIDKSEHLEYNEIFNATSVIAEVILGSTIMSLSFDYETFKFKLFKINPSHEFDLVEWDTLKQYALFHNQIVKLFLKYYKNNYDASIYRQICLAIEGSKESMLFKKVKKIIDGINVDNECNIELVSPSLEVVNLKIVPKYILQFSKNNDDNYKNTILVKVEFINFLKTGIQMAFGSKNSLSVTIPAYRFNELVEIKNGAYVEVEIKSNSKTGDFKRVVIKNDDS